MDNGVPEGSCSLNCLLATFRNRCLHTHVQERCSRWLLYCRKAEQRVGESHRPPRCWRKQLKPPKWTLGQQQATTEEEVQAAVTAGMVLDGREGQQGKEKGEHQAQTLNNRFNLWVILHCTGSFSFLMVQDMFFNTFFVCVGTGTKSEFLSEGWDFQHDRFALGAGKTLLMVEIFWLRDVSFSRLHKA